MHNIQVNFGRFQRICKTFFESQVNKVSDLQFYPRAPHISDLEIIALSCVIETLGIDSENLLWSKLQVDYTSMFPKLNCRTRFDRRVRRLQLHIETLQGIMGSGLQVENNTMVVDSIPVPVAKLAREKTYAIIRKDFDTAPAKGYSSVNQGWFIGYKMHVIIFDNGAAKCLDKGHVHDISLLKEVAELPKGKHLLGDRAYVSAPLQGDLFHNCKVKLKVPFRGN